MLGHSINRHLKRKLRTTLDFFSVPSNSKAFLTNFLNFSSQLSTCLLDPLIMAAPPTIVLLDTHCIISQTFNVIIIIKYLDVHITLTYC